MQLLVSNNKDGIGFALAKKKLRRNLSFVALKILHRIAISVFEKNACLRQWGENFKIEYMGEIGQLLIFKVRFGDDLQRISN